MGKMEMIFIRRAGRPLMRVLVERRRAARRVRIARRLVSMGWTIDRAARVFGIPCTRLADLMTAHGFWRLP